MDDGWRASYRVHPAADAFPLLDEDGLRELTRDIRENGLRHKLAFWRGQLLDGRNRAIALYILGHEPVHSDGSDERAALLEDDDDPIAFVVSANVRRRHLSSAQKREAIAALLKLAPERSDRQIARDVGADHKTVGRARRARESTGEIPQLRARAGADSRTRRVPTPRRRPEPERGPTTELWAEPEPHCKDCGAPLRCPDCAPPPTPETTTPPEPARETAAEPNVVEPAIGLTADDERWLEENAP